MSQPLKKFKIPLLTEEESADEIPQYFKPGAILAQSQEKPTCTSDPVQCDEQQNTPTNTQQNAIDNRLHSELKEVSKSVEGKSSAIETASRFESEFSHLRSSKFYDKALESTSSASENAQPKASEKPRSTSALLVNGRQRGNPLLKHIRSVPWEFGEIEPDYVIGRSACALFLSLKYHNLFPNYIHERLKALGKSYSLRVLLVQVDVVEPSPPLKDLSVIAILAECTLMVAWSAEEAGNYLETYKMYENKSADFIKEKQDDDNYSQLIDCLTTIRSINKTDAMVLLSTFKTLKGIVQASVDSLAMCPGFGPLKAKRLYDALRKPLKNEQRSVK